MGGGAVARWAWGVDVGSGVGRFGWVGRWVGSGGVVVDTVRSVDGGGIFLSLLMIVVE